MIRRLCLMWVPVLACSGPTIRGGVTVPAGQLPPGESIARYVPSGCADAAGAPAQWSTEFRLVRNAAGEHVLVERRPDQDALVIHRVSAPGQDYVFQVVVGGWLREIRLPVTAGGSGKMVVARDWRERPQESGFLATELGDVVVQCSLLPHGATGTERTRNSTDVTTAAMPAGESELRPAPEPSGGEPDPRTGY
jgi:hypothetical protein